MGKKQKVEKNWKNYAFEFLTIFAGITIAFLLNNWNENRKDRYAEVKILTEIKNGLQLDTSDFKHNISGHQKGIEACGYFRDLINQQPVSNSLANEQFTVLLRDFISIQNMSGYESLKSRGLELVSDDSLRMTIISMYEFNFQIIEKLEENYRENQFYETYFELIHEQLAPYMVYSSEGHLTGFVQPIGLNETDRTKMLTYLSKIEFNRRFIISYYEDVNRQAIELIKRIDNTLEKLD